MKCKFDITYIQLNPFTEPAEGLTYVAIKKTVEAEFPDGTSIDQARQKIAFEMEEQHCRIITMEGCIVE